MGRKKDQFGGSKAKKGDLVRVFPKIGRRLSIMYLLAPCLRNLVVGDGETRIKIAFQKILIESDGGDITCTAQGRLFQGY
jgi:hypothetical protein